MRDKFLLSVLCSCLFLLSLQVMVHAGCFERLYMNNCQVCNSTINQWGEYCIANCPSGCSWEAHGDYAACSGCEWSSCCYCGELCDEGGIYEGQCNDADCFTGWEVKGTPGFILPGQFYCRDGTQEDEVCCNDDDCDPGICKNYTSGGFRCDPNGCRVDQDCSEGLCIYGQCEPNGCRSSNDCEECHYCNPGTHHCTAFPNTGYHCDGGEGLCMDGECVENGCFDDDDCQECNMCDTATSSPTYERCVQITGSLDDTDMWCDVYSSWDGVCDDGVCLEDNLPPDIPDTTPYDDSDVWVNSNSVSVHYSDFGNIRDQTPAGYRDAGMGCYCLHHPPGNPYITTSSCYTDNDCGTFSPVSEIIHNSPLQGWVYYRVYDPAGNFAPSPSEPYYVRLDAEEPLTKDNHDGQLHGQGYTVTLTCDDDGYSGCDQTFYCVYNQGASPCTPTTDANAVDSSNCDSGECKESTVPIDCSTGTCNKIVRYYSTDVAGNSETVKDTDTITISADVPSCVMGDPLEYSGSPVDLSWSGTDPFGTGIKEFALQYSVDGGAYQDWDTFPGSTTSDSFITTQEGEYSFQCRATNNGDVIGVWSGAVTVKIDLNEPTAVTHTPEATGVGPFTVECAASDTISNVFTYDIQWSTDGSSWQDWVTSSTSSSHIFGQGDDPAAVDDGDVFYLRCRATDGVGLTSLWSPTNSTLVDSTPPSCAMTEPGLFQNTTAFQLTWSTPDMDVLSYDLCINNDGSACTSPTTGQTDIAETTRTLTGNTGNTYYTACRATDIAGNIGDWSGFVNTTIDTTPPSLDDSEYTENLTSTDYEDLIVDVTVSDEAGIDDVSLDIGGNEVSPTQSSGSSGDTEWSLVWEIPYDTYMAFTVFTITMDDVSGNSNSQDFSYSVSECNPGDVRGCNPLDSATGDAYTEGVCRGTGERTCQADKTWSTCTGGTFPTTEDCNDLDDDCDGEVDEDLASHSCGPSSDLGICVFGTSSCSGGNWTTCMGAVYPKANEDCSNDLDDDCNGIVNDDCVCEDTDPPIPCGESGIGICKLGQSYCVNGQRSNECVGAVYPNTEICDNTLDDDCDGLTDCGDSDCLDSSLCEGPPLPPPDEEPFPWWWLSVIGIVVLVVLAIVWYYFKSNGEDLTWETVKNKWSPTDRR